MTAAWAMKDKQGNILVWTVKRDEEESYRMAAMNHLDMKQHDCIRVRIVEVK